MKGTSPRTHELIRGLHASRSFWQRIVGRQDPPLWAFEEIAQSQEALAIPQLVPFLMEHRNEVRDAAARAIDQLIATAASLEFAQLDEACRNEWSYGASESSGWRRMQPNQVKEFWGLPAPVSVIGVTSFHANGFVRQAAVDELSNSFDGPELPFLLVRLNDWVEPIRESAAKAVRRRIRPDYAPHFFRHLRLVLRLHSCGRAEHKRIVDEIERLLSDPSADLLLREGIRSRRLVDPARGI